MAVKILKTTQMGTLYNPGELATFDDETEKRLIEQKFAEAYKPAKAADKPAA